MAIRVRAREFTGVVLDKMQEYKIYQCELDDGTFEYEFQCPLHSTGLRLILQKIYLQSQDEVISPICKHRYLISESEEVAES